ncbi:dihydrofolate reductase [Subtercola lobariae]|uniref:Dihydrofolate reductase n=2 Tax=Subtercola lobariae TaxID=1588641 RepID=A0A917BBR4_9MICO|nr:dihydrofolate reductase [Subtercola lobariae]
MSFSLDGFVAGARAESNWMLRAGTPDSAAWVLDTIAGAGTHIMGRALFESWIGIWPTAPGPMAEPLNSIPKVVFTRQQGFDPATAAPSDTPAAPTWADARVARGDLTAEIESLKNEPGDYILAHGGVRFARSLVRAGLVDEYRFVVLPVALGSGEGIFADLTDELDLTFASSTAFAGGVLANVYRPKG